MRPEWLWPVLITGSFLWMVFLWKEYGQTGKTQFFLRAVAALIAVGTLAALFLEPMTVSQEQKGVGIVTTDHFTQEQVDSLMTLHKRSKIIKYSENEPLQRQLDSLQRIYIVGSGVGIYDLWQFKNRSVSYIEGKPISGLTQVQYNPEMTLGDSLSIRGLYRMSEVGHQIVLEDPAGSGLDSIQFSEESNLRFGLGSLPKVAGRFLYKLVEKDSIGNLVSQEPLPVSISERNILRILIVNAYPTFETKYLKNFLAESGHEILVRSQLTRGKFKFENLNRDRGAVYGFTAKNLSDFDVLIIDSDSYLGLSRQSKSALDNQMIKAGLGVLIQLESSLINQGERFGFRLKRNNSTSTNINTWPKVEIRTYPFTFISDALTQPIVSTSDKILAAYSQRGAGRIGTFLAEDSYQLLLEGNDEVYRYLWSKTIESISQRSLPVAQWEMRNYVAYPDEPFSFTIRTSIPKPIVMYDSKVVALEQDVGLPDLWKGTIYPNDSGWKSLTLQQDSLSKKSVFVADPRHWRAMYDFEKQQANARYFDTINDVNQFTQIKAPLPLWWFLIIFAIAMGYLWLAPRFESA